MSSRDVVIVGNAGGTNVGASLQRAAAQLGLASLLCDATSASIGPRINRAITWRLFDHRPLHLSDFSRSAVEVCKTSRPTVLITTGLAPVTAEDLNEIKAMGTTLVNYSTDDPWNPAFRSAWFLAALKVYDHVYSVRRSNCYDMIRHGCPRVSYLPFGYDESLWVEHERDEAALNTPADVFFAGAADSFRVPYMRQFLKSGIRLALAGDYWRQERALRNYAVGHLSPGELRDYTQSVPISLCLVRHANRDGHVMRSFEIPAIGGCMIAENTEEHREIFGEDGHAVRYFRCPLEAAAIAQELLRDHQARRALSEAAHSLIVGAGNSYKDRLLSLMSSVHGKSTMKQLRRGAVVN